MTHPLPPKCLYRATTIRGCVFFGKIEEKNVRFQKDRNTCGQGLKLADPDLQIRGGPVIQSLG